MSHLMTALAMRQEGLKPATKIVLYWLADHHNEETGLCCPSLKRLSNLCQMGTSTVARHLTTLEEMGIIARYRRVRKNGSDTSSEYVLSIKQGIPNRDTPCPKMGHPPVPNRDTLNLGNNNLGIEQEDSCAKAVEIFNAKATENGWPKIQMLSPERKKLLEARLKEAGGLDGWSAAMDKAAASDFLCGRTPRAFRATFDFLSKKTNFIKLMEGNYDNRDFNGYGQASNTGRGSAHQKLLDGFSQFADEQPDD